MSNKFILSNIIEQFEWEEYIEDNYSVKYATGKNGRELRICCPKCRENSYKCYINPEKGIFHCFKCGFRSSRRTDLFYFVALTEGITRGQAIMRLLQEYRPLAPEEFEPVENPSDGSLRPLRGFPPMKTLTGLPEGCQRLLVEPGNEFWAYLENRGFTEYDLRVTNAHCVPKKHLRLTDSTGRYRGDLGRRVVFPVYGPNGKLVSWQGRSIDPGVTPKYLTAPDSDLSKTVWPFTKTSVERVVLVEGIIDALSVRRAKVPAYATFTKRISLDQIRVLRCLGANEVILWFDRKDAKKEMENAVDLLKVHFKGVYVLDLSEWPKDIDTGDCLAMADGVDRILRALKKPIDSYSLDYEKWKMLF